MSYFPNTFDAIDQIIDKGDQAGVKELGLRENSAELEYFMARAELSQEGNLDHGLKHLAELLRYDPGRNPWLDMLDAYIEKMDNPASVFDTTSEERYFAYEAVRAYILASEGKLIEALDILFAINNVKPDVPYLSCWAIEWLSSDEAFEKLSRDHYITVLLNGLRIFGEFERNDTQTLQFLDQYNKLFVKFHEKFEPDQHSLMGQAGLLRKTGSYDEAIKVSRSSFDKYADWYALISLGLALRGKGNSDEAEVYLQKAYDVDPDQGVSPYLEIADMYFNMKNWPVAMEWYNRILAIEHDNGWAQASKLYCRWKLLALAEYPEELITFSQQNPDNHRAYELLNEFRPFVGGLPRPNDATANVLSQILEQADSIEDGEGKNGMALTLSALESPSNILAFKLAFGEKFDLDITIESIPEPDPREAITEVPFRIWRYSENEAVPALQAPPEKVSSLVSFIASVDFELIWPAASRIAKDFTDKDINDLLAVIVHPPKIEGDFHVLDWIPRIQYTALAVIANITGDWNTSEKRDALYSILLGPRDWATEAAIVVLTKLVESRPALAVDVHQQFEKLQGAIPEKGACLYEYTLYYNWLGMPHLFDNEREDLRKILEGIMGE